jgi:NADPH:quinone reductase-like Zn-dependent oxidoreductase
VRGLGADRVIDYATEDFTKGDRRYDAILGVNGYHSLGAYKRCLEPGGRYVMVGGKNRQIFEVSGVRLHGAFQQHLGAIARAGCAQQLNGRPRQRPCRERSNRTLDLGEREHGRAGICQRLGPLGPRNPRHQVEHPRG